MTGKTTIAAMPLVLSTNPKGSKKVLAEALLIAREKNQPLNYNAGLILGKIAADAKDWRPPRSSYASPWLRRPSCKATTSCWNRTAT